MNYTFITKIYCLALGALVLLFPHFEIKAQQKKNDSQEVNPNFLLWKIDREYQTSLNANFSLKNAQVTVELDERKDAHGNQARSFHYQGSMTYSTWLQNAQEFNGTAGRYYGVCEINKIKATAAIINIPSSSWEVWVSRIGDIFGSGLPSEWNGIVKIVDRKATGDPYIKVETKPGFEEKVLGVHALAAGFQRLEGLSGKHLILEWQTPRNFEVGRLRVLPATNEGGKLVETFGPPALIVKDVIGREAKLLYDAMLGGSNRRKGGEMWQIAGDALDAMIHPALEGRFKGNVVVRAKQVEGMSPHRNIPDGVHGLKIEFLQRGTIGGRVHNSDLRFEIKTTEGETHSTNLMSRGSQLLGELWLDSINQSVRYAKLESKDTKYNGYLPKIGDLNDTGVKVDADLHFSFEFIQSISPRAVAGGK